MTDTDTKQ